MSHLVPNKGKANHPKPASKVSAPAPMPAIPPAIEMRKQRNGKIYQVEWMKNRHMDQILLGKTPTLTSDQYNNLLNYIQALRDVPQNSSDPKNPVWPAVPSYVTAPLVSPVVVGNPVIVKSS